MEHNFSQYEPYINGQYRNLILNNDFINFLLYLASKLIQLFVLLESKYEHYLDMSLVKIQRILRPSTLCAIKPLLNTYKKSHTPIKNSTLLLFEDDLGEELEF